MKLHHLILSTIIVAGLTACAGVPVSSDKPKGIAAFVNDARLGEQVQKICFNRNIDGFYNATQDTIVLTTGISDDYIVEVRGVCNNLRFAKSIAVDSTLSCVTRGDALLVSVSAFSLSDGTSIGPDRCLIEKMYKWNKAAASGELNKSDVSTETSLPADN
jgi:hypothetical protein